MTWQPAPPTGIELGATLGSPTNPLYVTGVAGGLVVAEPVTVDGTVTAVPQAATLVVTTQGAVDAAVTITLPAVASQFHYITMWEIAKFTTIALGASGTSTTPTVITTTNLPGSLAFIFQTGSQTRSTIIRDIYAPAQPLRSSVANTATTFVAPAQVGIIWRLTAYYYTAA